MPHRYEDEATAAPSGVLRRLGHGLREARRAGYSTRDFKSDLLAGLVVGIVALPLAMALAIASGVPPQHGLYTSIIAGSIIAVAGGSRFNVSGPTAAFVVLLAPVSAKFGLGGLMMASLIAGVFMIVLGLARLGRLIEYIPYPVTTGFTAGIGVVIASIQLPSFFGLELEGNTDHFIERMIAVVKALPSWHWQEFMIGGFTLTILVLWPKVTKRIPGPLVAITAAAAVAYAFMRNVDGFQVTTIGSRFGGIPQVAPHFDWPWNYPNGQGNPIGISLAVLRDLMSPAFAIAALGAIESLLCAVVADGMAGTRHDSDVELTAQGLGNVVAPFFGGFAATGAIARTATGIRAGARSPVSAVVHALFVLAAVLALAPLLAWLPMAALAALLMVVAWNMSDARQFVHIVRVAPKSDVAVLLTCFGLTVIFDMTIAVTFGILLAALLFMKRMSAMFQTTLADSQHEMLKDPEMQGVIVYQIRGPLFFGAAGKAVSTLARVRAKTRAVILQMDDVPVMDISGLVALESAIRRLHASKVFVAIAGVQSQPRSVLDKAGVRSDPAWLAVCDTHEEAIESVRKHLMRMSAAH